MHQKDSMSNAVTAIMTSAWQVLCTLRKWTKVSLLTLFALLLYTLYHSYARIIPPSLLYIPDNNRSLLAALQQQRIPLNILDYRLIKRYPRPPKGWVRFDTKTALTREALIQSLQKRPRERTRRIVMYSGATIQDFASRTAQQTNLSADKILAQYHYYSPYLDGGIMAGYYQIPYRTTPSAIAYYMTMASKQRFEVLANTYLGNYDISEWLRILTIASIIQKETQETEEMPLISSVIYNRLKKGMKLQLDATLNYGKYSHTPVTPKRIQKDTSRYNTYRHKGLPPYPIGSATQEAILAALKPAKTEYLYFMLADKGTHNFAAAYPEHLAHIRWYNLQKGRNSSKRTAPDDDYPSNK